MKITPDLIAAAVFAAAALLTALTAFLVLDVLKQSRYAAFLKKAAKQLMILPSRTMDNFEKLDEILSASPEGIREAYRRFRSDSSGILRNNIAPDPEGYFNDRTVLIPYCGRQMAKAVAALIVVLAVMGAVVPFAAVLFYEQPVTAQTVTLSMAAFLSIVVMGALFFFFDQLCESKAKKRLTEFVRAVGFCVPTAMKASEAALLIEALAKNCENFETSVDRISQKIDEFATTSIVPAVAGLFDAAVEKNLTPALTELKEASLSLTTEIVSRQENGMKELADRFSQNLESGLKEAMETLAELVRSLSGDIEAIKGGIDHSYVSSLNTLNESKSALDGALAALGETKTLSESATGMLTMVTGKIDEMNERSLELSLKTGTALEALRDFVGRSDSFIESCGRGMSGTIDAIRDYREEAEKQIEEANNRLSDKTTEIADRLQLVSDHIAETLQGTVAGISEGLRETLQSNADTAERLFAALQAMKDVGSEQYEAAAEAASALLQKVTGEMDRAMSGVGREVADSIREANLANQETSSFLSDKLTALKEDYDSYFSRMEESTQKVMDDLDFNTQGSITLFADKTAEVLSSLGKSLTDTMERFEKTTESMLSAYDEQARSIGLYAKELDVDINLLSTTLKESVEQFSSQLHNTVDRTFNDFDKGMSEITERLADTVKNIDETVANLPKIIHNP